MKKRILSLILFIVISSLLCVSASAESGISFYIPKCGNKRPELPKEEKIILEYDGYYLNPNVNDDAEDKVIYLTFDLGYVNDNARSVVETLREKNVNACFFILDHVALHETELLKEMKNDGHLIGNHTKNHKDMTKVSAETMAKNLSDLEKIYEEKTGNKLDKYFRFPEGKFSEETLKTARSLGYKTIFWSFAYPDWDNNKQPDPEASVKKILGNTHNGEIILLHPTSKTNATILPRLIDSWREMGYRFGTLDELTA